jgi:hypothetical protein
VAIHGGRQSTGRQLTSKSSVESGFELAVSGDDVDVCDNREKVAAKAK